MTLKFYLPFFGLTVLLIFTVVLNLTDSACVAPNSVENATFSPNATSYNINDLVTYTCDVGFNMSSGDDALTCDSTGNWNGTLPVCTIMTCTTPDSAQHATFTPNSVSYNYSDTVTYACETGFQLSSGNLSRTCTSNGTWDGTLLNCAYITCAPPGNVENATHSPIEASYNYSNTITYLCNSEYDHIEGDLERSCGADTIWTGTPPVCKNVTCLHPNISNVIMFTENPTYRYNDSVQMTCEVGYAHISGDLEIFCDANSSWSEFPVCKNVTCLPPENVSNSLYTPVQDTYGYLDTVTYTCDAPEYVHTSGDLQWNCTENSTWSGITLVCTLTCAPPPETSNGSYSTVSSRYLPNSNVTYTCDTGFRHTSGNLLRYCNVDGSWTGTTPVCTIKTCNRPNNGIKATTLTPDASVYNYNTVVTYICDFAYELDTGSLTTRCSEFENWTEPAPDCKLVTCPTVDIQYMTHTSDMPQNNDTTYDYNTTVTYECILGYNHSVGDLERRCSEHGNWTATEPGCVIVTCDPPDDVIYTTYSPIQDEYDYNTGVTYECDTAHHYVSGDSSILCNYTGIFPTPDFSCSDQHFLEFLDPNQPQPLKLIESSANTTIDFGFDGLCTPTAEVSPDRLSLMLNVSDYNFTVTLPEYDTTVPDIYTLTVASTRLGRQLPNVSLVVFYGRPVGGIQGRVDNPISLIEVEQPVEFEVTLTDGTNVTIQWDFESGVSVTQVYDGAFISSRATHTFNTTGDYSVKITASNYISSLETYVHVRVIHSVDGATLTGATLVNTTSPAEVTVTLAKIPVEYVSIYVTYSHGNANLTTEYPDTSPGPTVPYTFQHLFETQGQYTVLATVQNPINSLTLQMTINVWDSLEPIDLIITDGSNRRYITNTMATVEFINVPNSGFNYSIDWLDGFSDTNEDGTIFYAPYNLGNFTHVYTSPLVYYLRWEARNPFYYSSGSIAIIVQNALPSNESQYMLEPIQKKYPWINLQSMAIPFNITLNSDIPVATNATCVFDPGDGANPVSNLEFIRLFKTTHNFANDGTFLSTISCTNEVSNYTFTYNNTMMKFLSDFITVEYVETVPLNVSDTVTVDFHIHNDGFDLLPEQVTLRFEFQPGSVEIHTYDKTLYSFTYSERGNYTVNLIVTAASTSTQTTLNLPLRLGWMHFEHHMTTAFFNITNVGYYTWGIPGTVTYSIDYVDGTTGSCTVSDIYGCDLTHQFLTHGIKTIVAKGQNATFLEIDEMIITVDGEIKELLKFMPDTIAIPDGKLKVILNVSAQDSILPDLNCNFDFADAIDREMRHHQQWLRHSSPYEYDFQYISLGRRVIDMYCWNLLNDTTLGHSITVTNVDFMYTGSFDRFFSQQDSPLVLSAMKDNEIFCRLAIIADFNTKTPHYSWSLSADNNRATYVIPRGAMSAGVYYVALNVSFVEEPDNVIFEPTYIQIVYPDPVPYIIGGPRRSAKRGNTTLNATLSYDPVRPSTSLTYSWTCNGYDSVSSFDHLVSQHSAGGASSCSVTSDSLGLAWFDSSSSHEGYVVALQTTTADSRSSSYIQYIFMQTTEDLSILCRINCLSKVAVGSKLHLVPDLESRCAATFTWSLSKNTNGAYSAVNNLADITETGSTNRSLVIMADSLHYTSEYRVSLLIDLDRVTYGPAYYEFLTNTIPDRGECSVFPYDSPSTTLENSTITGYAAITEFNLTCKYWRDEGAGSVMTKEEPLFFEFFYQYGDTEQYKHIVYFDSGGTSPLLTFRVGNVNNSYLSTVVLRISDQYGDHRDFTYPLTSVPALTNANLTGLNSTEVDAVVQPFIDQFDDAILKANRSLDYRTLATKIEAAASIYTLLVVETEESTRKITPAELTSLGNMRSEDGSPMDWNEFWDVIFYSAEAPTQAYLRQNGRNVSIVNALTVEHLIERFDLADARQDYFNVSSMKELFEIVCNHIVIAFLKDKGDMYMSTLLYQVTAWPTGNRMGLEAIELIARSLNTTVSNADFVDNNTAELAANIIEQLSLKLAEHVSERILQPADKIITIAQVLIDVAANILNYLQTILTPMLPDDPTTDEMRRYLQYIEVFNDDTSSSQLSLQEQTFLVQKQLQKYALMKYRKSQTSMVVVPKFVNAMKTIGQIMEALSEIGQQPLMLDNTFLEVTTEHNTAGAFSGTMLVRSRVSLALNDIQEVTSQTCYGSSVYAHMINYKINPFFWGTFGDRLTSYIPTFRLKGARFGSTVTAYFQNQNEAQCRDQTPTYAEGDPDKMIYILFDRTYSDDDVLLFVKPNISGLSYELFFQTEEKPDIIENEYFYSTEMNSDIWSAEDGYKLPISAENIPYTGKIWIGLRPIVINPADLSRRDELLNAKFCAAVTSGNCLIWKRDLTSGQDFWDKDSCRVSTLSSRKDTVCQCDLDTNAEDYTVGTTFFVPFSKVDFTAVGTVTYRYSSTPVWGTVVAIYVVYLLIACWAWREDAKDQYKWSYSPLVDNDIADTRFYILKVFTGLRGGSGTMSRVGFVLVGDENDTDIRIMDDDSHIGFERGSVRTFILTTRRILGELLCIRIWHDDSGGTQASWFLNRIAVHDVQTGKRYNFKCEKWLSSEEGDGNVERILTADSKYHGRSLQETLAYTLVNNHLWISLFLHPMRSNFTRVQRISCLLTILLLAMFIVMLDFKKRETFEVDQEVVIGPLRFSILAFNTSILAIILATLPLWGVAFLFAYSTPSDETHNGLLRRLYRAIPKIKKVDKSVVPTTYVPPISPAVTDSRHFLPRACYYIAWGILIGVAAFSTYFIVVSSSDWLETTSEQWMTTVILTLLDSIVIIDTCKVAVLIILSIVLFNNAYEPAEPNVDLDSLRELTRKNSHFSTVGPQYKDKLHYPEIPTNRQLLLNKKKRLEQSQAWSILYNLIIYCFLLTIVYTISYASRDERSFRFKNHMVELFKFDEVSDMHSYMDWLNNQFTNTYFAQTYFGDAFGNDSFKYFTQDLVNLKVGPARLRQVRVRKEPCQGPLGEGVACYDEYTESKEETIDYCLGWKNEPCPVNEKADFFSSPAWKYHSEEEVWGFPTEATYTTYGGGGYFMKLDVNKDVSIEIFNELTRYRWVDRHTRTVILEFTVFNANANLFSYTKFVAEFPEVGGVIPYTNIQTFRLFTHSGTDGNLVLFFEFFFLIYVFIAAVMVLYDMCSYGLQFFFSAWRVLDLVALGMSVSTVALFIYKLFLIEKTIAVFREDKNAYVGFENLAFYDFLVNTLHGMLVFLLSIRLSRVLGFSGKINEMAAVITTAATDLIGFCIIFGITYGAYVMLGTLLFGKDTVKYKSIFDTYGTLTEAIIGKNRMQEIMSSKPGLAELYYSTFVLFVLFTLATMAAAILNFSISHVKIEVADELQPLNAVELVILQVKKLMTYFKFFKTKSSYEMSRGRRNRRRSSDTDLMEVLDELKLSVRKILNRKRKKEKCSKYMAFSPAVSVIDFEFDENVESGDGSV